MKKKIVFLLGLLACGFMYSPASAQGLIGTRHAGIEGGYLRFSGDGPTNDGWGVGGLVNVPLTQEERFGFDFIGSASYLRLTAGDLTVDGYGATGGVRGYALLDPRFVPFVDLGIAWSRAKAEFQGQSETASGFGLPVAVGVEFIFDAFSIAPFFEYHVGLSDDVEDSWSIGARATYWVTPAWGLTLDGAHTEFEDDFDGYSIFGGVIFAF